MAERTTRTVVGYDVDRASIQKVVVGNQAIRNSIEGVRDVLGDLGASTAFGVNALTTQFDALGRNIQDDLRIVDDLQAELKALDNIVVEPEIRVQRSGGGSGARGNNSGLESVDRFGTTGSQILGALGASEAGNVVGLVGDLAQGFSTLNPVMLGVTALSVGFTAALGGLSKQYDESARSARNLIATQEAYFSLLVEGTSASVQAAIDAKRMQVEIARLTYEELNRVVETGYQQTSQTLGVFTDTFLEVTNAGGARELRTRRDEALQQYQQETFLLGRIETLLGSEATARNDSAAATEEAIAAEHELADARRNEFAEAARAAGQALADQANNRLEVDRMTAEERQTRAQEIQRQIDLLSGSRQSFLAQQTTAGGQAAYLLGQQIADLQDELIRVTDTTQTYADTLAQEEARKKSLADQTDNTLDSLTAEVKVREDIFNTQQEIVSIGREARQKQIATETDYNEKTTEIVTEGRDRLTDIEDKGAKERAKIARDFSRTYTQAVGERDALAGKNAKIAAVDRLADQQEGYDEQLRTQTKALDKQLQSLERSYFKQITVIDDAANREINTKNAALQRMQIDLTNAKYAEISIAQYGAGTQRSIHEYMWGQINQTAVAWASNTVNSVRGIMGAYTGSYATQYPMGVGGQQPVTLNYNVTGTQNAITTTTFRNLLQAASTRSGAGSAYQ